jgi:hypothetical protein
MKLPNPENAVVDERKVREYLLSRSHPVGRFKAAFFARGGFTNDNVGLLTTELLKLAAHGEAELGHATEHGQKYLISGILSGPAGATIEVTSVWIVPKPAGIPRLVTVYPR